MGFDMIKPNKHGDWTKKNGYLAGYHGVSYGKLGSLTYLVGMEAAVNGAMVVRILKNGEPRYE